MNLVLKTFKKAFDKSISVMQYQLLELGSTLKG